MSRYPQEIFHDGGVRDDTSWFDAVRRSCRTLALAISVGVAACASHQAAFVGYTPRVALPLSRQTDRIEGSLDLLEDARIQPDMRTAIADAFGGDPCATSPADVLHPLCQSVRKTPLRLAVLVLRDRNGRVIAADTADRPLADLTVRRLYDSARQTYLFTVDRSAGIGSYSGPFTRLAEPDARGFGWLVADGAGVANDTISLVTTLKTAWRAAPRADGRGDDLLMLLCRPDFTRPDTAAVRFVLTWERYTFTGQRWELHSRQTPGCYENDRPFPPATAFP